MKRVYLSTYRLFGFTFLFGISATIVSFFFLMLFFLANNSWVAPTVLSPTSDRMLTFANAYQQMSQNVETLRGRKHAAEVEYATAVSTYQDYASLRAGLGRGHGKLVGLEGQKQADLQRSAALARQLEQNQKQIDRSLKAGLITRAEAAREAAAAQGFHNSLTDSRFTMTTASLGEQAARTQAGVNTDQARSLISIKKNELDLAAKVLEPAERQLARLRGSAYYRAMSQNGANLAFVPYENREKVTVGAPVFDCYLLVIGCRQVGTVKEILTDEQVVDFPIFNVRFSRTVRGTFAVLEIAPGEQDSMHDKLFFVNRKPLLI